MTGREVSTIVTAIPSFHRWVRDGTAAFVRHGGSSCSRRAIRRTPTTAPPPRTWPTTALADRLTVSRLSKSDQDLGKLTVTPTNNQMVDTRSAIPTFSLPTRRALGPTLLPHTASPGARWNNLAALRRPLRLASQATGVALCRSKRARVWNRRPGPRSGAHAALVALPSLRRSVWLSPRSTHLDGSSRADWLCWSEMSRDRVCDLVSTGRAVAPTSPVGFLDRRCCYRPAVGQDKG